jgi:hypothetical protein
MAAKSRSDVGRVFIRASVWFWAGPVQCGVICTGRATLHAGLRVGRDSGFDSGRIWNKE